MEDDFVSPIAANIIAKCGGHKAVATMTGVTLKQVYCWTYARTKGGTDGRIPHDHQEKLLSAARAKGIALTPADFFAPEQPAQPKPDKAA